MRLLSLTSSFVACVVAASVVQAGSILPVINEFVANHTGTDDMEYAEIFGDPNTDYSAYTIVEIEGDSGQTGLIDDFVRVVGTTDANGIWVSAFDNNALENGTLTLLLVTGYTGSLNDDVDTDDDGVIDTTFWASIADSVAVFDGGGSDLTYSSVVLSPGFDGDAFTPGGASRIPNGVDTNSVSDWKRNTFDHITNMATITEAFNTPGAINRMGVPEPGTMVLLLMAGLALTGVSRRMGP